MIAVRIPVNSSHHLRPVPLRAQYQDQNRLPVGTTSALGQGTGVTRTPARGYLLFVDEVPRSEGSVAGRGGHWLSQARPGSGAAPVALALSRKESSVPPIAAALELRLPALPLPGDVERDENGDPLLRHRFVMAVLADIGLTLGQAGRVRPAGGGEPVPCREGVQLRARALGGRKRGASPSARGQTWGSDRPRHVGAICPRTSDTSPSKRLALSTFGRHRQIASSRWRKVRVGPRRRRRRRKIASHDFPIPCRRPALPCVNRPRPTALVRTTVLQRRSPLYRAGHWPARGAGKRPGKRPNQVVREDQRRKLQSKHQLGRRRSLSGGRTLA